MTQALKYLNVELNTSSSDRSSLAKYRAATIHHRLASLLHNTFRTDVDIFSFRQSMINKHLLVFQDNPSRRKRLRALASLHYQKALELFSPTANPLEYLRLLIEEVALADFELQSDFSPTRFLRLEIFFSL